MNPLDFFKDILPSISIGQALVLLVIIDLGILFAVIIKSIRKGGEPSKKKAPKKPTPPERRHIYYDVEETTEEPTDDALKDVAEALEGLPKPTYQFPTPPLHGAPAHVQAMLQRTKHPNLFTSQDVRTGIPLSLGEGIRVVDPTTVATPSEKKTFKRDGFVV